MSRNDPSPLCLTPVPVARPWGGDRASSVANLPPTEGDDPIGEWWLLSTRPDAPTRVATGPHAGRTLHDVIDDDPWTWLGRSHSRWCERFPLLIKLLDADEVLSVQLHPSDSHVAGQGKTESWLVLDAGPDAQAFLGLKNGDTGTFFDRASDGDDVSDLLDHRPLHRGGVVHVPAGLIHALAGPVVALEVQQNSDTTYRIHDWNREPRRELHLEQARPMANSNQRPVLPHPVVLQETPFRRESLVRCDAYSMERLTLPEPIQLATDGAAFQVLVPLGQSIQITADENTTVVPRGQACLIAATQGRYQVAAEGPVDLVRLLPPSPSD